MVNIKNKLMAVCLGLTVFISKALAAENDTFTPDLANGQKTLMSLQYADKAKLIIDVLYTVINWAAIVALLVLVIKFLLGGWDSLEHEIRSRHAIIMIILIILVLKFGLVIISWVMSW